MPHGLCMQHAPRARAKAQGKAKAATSTKAQAAKRRRKAQVAAPNVRRDGRREALRAFNNLARDVGVRELPHLVAHRASRAAAVERMVRLLGTRCADDFRGPLLRAAAKQWLANGGTFREPLLPLPALAGLAGPRARPRPPSSRGGLSRGGARAGGRKGRGKGGRERKGRRKG